MGKSLTAANRRHGLPPTSGVGMTGSAYVLAGLALLVGLDGTAAAFDRERPGSTAPFAVANLRLEQNVTDDDFEIVLEAKGGATGLAQLIGGVSRRTHHRQVTAPDTSTLGMRQFRFESPEPKSAASLKAAYPEGVYAFTGATAAGAKLQRRIPPQSRAPSAGRVSSSQARREGCPDSRPGDRLDPDQEPRGLHRLHRAGRTGSRDHGPGAGIVYDLRGAGRVSPPRHGVSAWYRYRRLEWQHLVRGNLLHDRRVGLAP